MTWLLAASIALAVVDAVVTHSRIKLNPLLELNPLVRKLGRWPFLACFLGVAIPQSVISSVLSPIPCALFVGAQLYRTFTQMLSMPIYKQLCALETLRSLPSPRVENRLD